MSALQLPVWLTDTLTWRWSLEDVPAVASISTPSSFRVRNMSPRYQGTEMVMSRSLHDTTLSPLKRCGCGITADTDQALRYLPKSGREHLLSYQPVRMDRCQPHTCICALRASSGLCRCPSWLLYSSLGKEALRVARCIQSEQGAP